MREANAHESILSRRADDLSHDARILVTHRLEAGDDPSAIGSAAVLARLPFSPYVEDLDLDADDRPALHGDEIGRRVADRPRRCATLFERLGQLLRSAGQATRRPITRARPFA